MVVIKQMVLVIGKGRNADVGAITKTDSITIHIRVGNMTYAVQEGEGNSIPVVPSEHTPQLSR